MSRTRAAARVGGALALVCVALALAILGRDVLAWRGQQERTDVAIAHFSRSPDVGRPDTWLPVGISRFLLGTGNDVEFARALQGLQLLRGSGQDPQTFRPPALELARLELAFESLADGAGPAETRSRARELHALLLLQQLFLQEGFSDSFGTSLERAIAELQKAVRIDPTNDEAQYDLEALLLVYKPVATELAGERAYQKTNKGNTGAAGGSPGATGETGGF